MDETTKILIGTISGFIIAFFAEPVKTFFSNKSKLSKLRLALYKELIQNFLMLELALDEFRKDNNSNILVGQPLMLVECYRYAMSQETTLFYELKEARLLNSFYKILDAILAIPNGEKKYRTVLAEDLVEGAVGMVKGGLDTGILDRVLVEQVTSKKEVKEIISRIK